jgi:hypothetical protein
MIPTTTRIIITGLKVITRVIMILRTMGCILVIMGCGLGLGMMEGRSTLVRRKRLGTEFSGVGGWVRRLLFGLCFCALAVRTVGWWRRVVVGLVGV